MVVLINMYQEIKDIIKNQASYLDETTLTYFSNYFYVLVKRKVIYPNLNLAKLINNALMYASKIEFYDENHRVYKENGGDTKGLCDAETKTIYIRGNLPEPIREMTVYHEIHHAVQTNPLTNEVGINQTSNIGRLIMEAQTQYFAEIVYTDVHDIQYEEREIPSNKLRMLNGGTVISALHNYELYDCFLSKLAIILDVSKDYFVFINFLYEDNAGLKDLEEKYNIAKEKYKLPYNFDGFMLTLDYIYCVDYCAYKKNPEKENILNGKETACHYEIHPNKYLPLSLAKQGEVINHFDVNYFLALLESKHHYRKFARYVIDNQKHELINQYIATYSETEANIHSKKS